MQNKQPGSIVGIANENWLGDKHKKKKILINLKPQKMYLYSRKYVFRQQFYHQQSSTHAYIVLLYIHIGIILKSVLRAVFTLNFYDIINILWLTQNMFFIV